MTITDNQPIHAESTQSDEVVTRDSLLAEIKKLEPQIRAASEAIDLDRRVPDEIVEKLYDIGVFRAFMPREVGGLELSPTDWLDLVYELSRINGSVGWLAMICAGHTFLEAEPLNEMLADGSRWITALNGARVGGEARRVDGGYRVTGKWPFASSGPYAQFAGGMSFLKDDDGEMVIHPSDGLPWMVMSVVPKGDFTYTDTWDGLGLRGTGSGDVELDDVFVPESHVMQSLSSQPYDGPLYRSIMLFQIAGHAAHALGIARGAVESFISAANVAPHMGSMRQMTLGKQQSHHIGLAQADAMIRSARLFVWDSVSRAYDDALTRAPGDKVNLELRVLIRESTTWAVRTSKDAVNLVFEALGSGAVKRGNPIELAYRDVSTASQHVMHVKETLGLSGQYWLTKDAPDGPTVDGGLMAFF